MADKITRYDGDFPYFAHDAAAEDVRVFGDETTSSDDLTDNITNDFLVGWRNGTDAEGKPPIQWFNALGLTLSRTLQYLHQMGVPEWHASQVYHTGSAAQKGTKLYISQSDNNSGNDPESDTDNWAPVGGGATSERQRLMERIERDATLLLDFKNNRYRIYEGLADGHTEKPYSQIITHTRASDATGFNALGTLSTVTDDTQRLVYSPETGRSEGLLVEEERTNSLLDNRDLSTGNWSGNAVVAKDAVGLDGVTNSAHTITDDNESAGLDIEHFVSISEDTSTHTAIYYVGKDNNIDRFPFFGMDISPAGIGQQAIINTSNGNIESLRNNDGTTEVFDAGDFWEVVHTLQNDGTGNSIRYLIIPARNSDGSPDSDDSTTGSIVYDFGQVELNSPTASSPIETGGTAVTRAADVVTQDEVGKWFKQESFTLLVEFGKVETSDQYLINLEDSNDPNFNRISILCENPQNGTFQPRYVVGGNTIGSPVSITAPQQENNKVALSFERNGNEIHIIFAYNGSSGSNSGELNTIVADRFLIGQGPFDGDTKSVLRSISALPCTLTESEAQALTQTEE